MMNHTSGPWSVIELENGHDEPMGVYEVHCAGPAVVAADISVEADARLIALAPEMAEVLHDLIELCDDYAFERDERPEAPNRARALLAKLED